MNTSVALAKYAYSGFDATGGNSRRIDDYQPYFDLLADDVVLELGAPRDTPLSGEFRGRQAVIDFFAATIPSLLEDVRLEGPLEFIGTGDRAVVLGRENYKIKETDLAVHGKAFADILHFHDGRIVRALLIREMNEFIDACRVHGGREAEASAPPWTEEQINIGLARRFWSFFEIHSSQRDRHLGGGDQTLFDLLADDVVWIHEGHRDQRVPAYPGEIRGKQALIDMITTEAGVISDLDLEDPIGSPLEFVAGGDRVVVVNREHYRITKTGVTVRNNRNAVVMGFRDGLVANIRIIANLSDYIESHLGVGWSVRSS